MGFAELDFRRHAEIYERTKQRLRHELVEKCSRCKGTGLIIQKGWDEELDLPKDRGVQCECRVTFRLRAKLCEAGVPEEFWQVETLKPTFNEENFELIRRYSERLDNAMRHGLSLLLTGKNGSGKTSSATLAVVAALRQGRSAAMVSWPDYIDGQRRAWKDQEHGRSLDERVMRDLVVLDEIGKEHETNDTTFAIGKLDSLLRMRRGANLPSIIITNLKPQEFATRYGASVESMIADSFRTVTYRPGDYRIKREKDWDALLDGGAE